MNSSDATLFFECVVGVQVALFAKPARLGGFLPVERLLIRIVVDRHLQPGNFGVPAIHLHKIACALQRSCRTGWPATRHEVRMGSIHGSEAVLPFTLVEGCVLSRKSLHSWIDLWRREPSHLIVTRLIFAIVIMPVIH